MAKYCIRCGNRNNNGSDVCDKCAALERVPEAKLLPENDYAEGYIDEQDDKIIESSVPLEELHIKNSLIENGLLEEEDTNRDFIYTILSDKAEFSSTEYKVVNSGGNQGLLKCKKIKYNGKDALYYMTGKYKAINIIMPRLTNHQFLCVLENLMNQVVNIKNNGFLEDVGVDIRLNRIYVDQSTLQVFLTYIPIKPRCYTDVIYLEDDLRKELAYIMKKTTNMQSSNAIHIAELLEESSYSFDNLLLAVKTLRR